MVVLRPGTAEQHDVGGVGHRPAAGVDGADQVDTGHVVGDVAAVNQKALSVRVAVADEVSGQHRGGDHLVGGDIHARVGEQVGDLHAGTRRGVGQVGPRNLVVGQRPQRLPRTRDGLPRGHQHTVDVEEHSTGSHGATVNAQVVAQLVAHVQVGTNHRHRCAQAQSATQGEACAATAQACPAGMSMTWYRLMPAAVAAISVATPARR